MGAKKTAPRAFCFLKLGGGGETRALKKFPLGKKFKKPNLLLFSLVLGLWGKFWKGGRSI